jgi:hypothetical protein
VSHRIGVSFHRNVRFEAADGAGTIDFLMIPARRRNAARILRAWNYESIGAGAPACAGKGTPMKRRAFLQAGMGASAGVALGLGPHLLRSAAANTAASWRKFEVVTKIEVANPTGVTRAWVPVPLLTDTDSFKRQGDTWTGNAAAPRVVKTPSTISASCTPSGRPVRRRRWSRSPAASPHATAPSI